VTSDRADMVLDVISYAAFLHDRLVMRAPGIATIRFDPFDADSAGMSGVAVTRVDLADGAYELRLARSAIPSDPGPSLVLPISRKGRDVGRITFVVPSDLNLGPEMLRRLALYGQAAASGLLLDAADGVWSEANVAAEPIVEAREVVSGAHHERVSGFASIIVRALREPLGLSDEFCDAVVRYSVLHDIGQVAFADTMGRRRGRLDDDEWRLMKTHTTRGRLIADDLIAASTGDVVPRPDVLRNVLECHHETLDGEGYPHGLAGDAVPLEARIVCVADIFDALVSARPYKPGWSADAALDEMDRLVVGGKIDGRCLIALVTHPDLVEAVAAGGMENPRQHSVDPVAP